MLTQSLITHKLKKLQPQTISVNDLPLQDFQLLETTGQQTTPPLKADVPTGFICYRSQLPANAAALKQAVFFCVEDAPDQNTSDSNTSDSNASDPNTSDHSASDLDSSDRNVSCGYVLFPAACTPVRLLNEIISLYSQLVRWDKSCHQMIISGCTLAALCQEFSKISEKPLAVFDPDFQVIGLTSSETCHVPAIDRLIELGHTPVELIPIISRQNIPTKLQTSTSSLFLPSADHPEVFHLYRRHQKNQVDIAYSCVFCDLSEADRGYQQLCEWFFSNLDFYFKETARYDKLENYMYEYIMRELMTHHYPALENQMKHQLASVGIPEQAAFCLIQIVLRTENMPQLSYIRKLLYQHCPLAKPFLHNDGIYLLCYQKKSDFLSTDYCAVILSQIQDALLLYPHECYISNHFPQLCNIFDAGIQCDFVAKTREPLLLTSPDEPMPDACAFSPVACNAPASAFFYESLMPIHARTLFLQKMDASCLLSERFLCFLNWDKKNTHPTRDTLFTYLSHNCNLKETAGILNLHRNTIEYQIKKIQEALDLDFSDAAVRELFLFCFHLQMDS